MIPIMLATTATAGLLVGTFLGALLMSRAMTTVKRVWTRKLEATADEINKATTDVVAAGKTALADAWAAVAADLRERGKSLLPVPPVPSVIERTIELIDRLEVTCRWLATLSVSEVGRCTIDVALDTTPSYAKQICSWRERHIKEAANCLRAIDQLRAIQITTKTNLPKTEAAP